MTMFQFRIDLSLLIIGLVRRYLVPSGCGYKFALKREVMDKAYLLSLKGLMK